MGSDARYLDSVSDNTKGRSSLRRVGASRGPRNLRAIAAVAVGFATLCKAAMPWTPTSRKSRSNAPHRPFRFEPR